MRNTGLLNKGLLHFVAMAVLIPFALFGPGAGRAGAQAPVEDMFIPWDGFSAYAASGAAIVVNPAALVEVREHDVRVEAWRPEEASNVDAMAYVYHEPDTGLGAGQLGYVTLTEGTGQASRFVYSGAKTLGRTGAAGFAITHTRWEGSAPDEAFSTWGLDVGLRGALSDGVTVGAVLRNAYVSSKEAEAILPATLAAGFALHAGPMTIAADYVLQGREAPFVHGYAYGVEAHLGPVALRYGERNFSETLLRYVHYGLGYGFRWGRIDLTVGERSAGRLWMFGVSLAF